jgi:membrane protease subunit (stomatin/prohibitin family)
MKVIDTTAIEELRHKIFVKVLENVDIDVRRKVSIHVYANGQIEMAVNIEGRILDFFASLNKD